MNDKEFLQKFDAARKAPGFLAYYIRSYRKKEMPARWGLVVCLFIAAGLAQIAFQSDTDWGIVWGGLWLFCFGKLLWSDITACNISRALEAGLKSSGINSVAKRPALGYFPSAFVGIRERRIVSPTDLVNPVFSFRARHEGKAFSGYILAPKKLVKPITDYLKAKDLTVEDKRIRCALGFFEAKRDHKSQTIITTQEPLIYRWVQSKTIGLKRANLVDPEFEKDFEAYTGDQLEARFLFDPAKIAKLVDLKKQYGLDELVVSVKGFDASIMLAFSDSFFTPVNDLPNTTRSQREALKFKRQVEILTLVKSSLNV